MSVRLELTTEIARRGATVCGRSWSTGRVSPGGSRSPPCGWRATIDRPRRSRGRACRASGSAGSRSVCSTASWSPAGRHRSAGTGRARGAAPRSVLHRRGSLPAAAGTRAGTTVTCVEVFSIPGPAVLESGRSAGAARDARRVRSEPAGPRRDRRRGMSADAPVIMAAAGPGRPAALPVGAVGAGVPRLPRPRVGPAGAQRRRASTSG